MRIWNENLLKYLPYSQFNSQHRECCALRGEGWKKPHSVVDWIFKYPPEFLIEYHMRVLDERERRGYNYDPIWRNRNYRGSDREPWEVIEDYSFGKAVYLEHNTKLYLRMDVSNLLRKGILLNINYTNLGIDPDDESTYEIGYFHKFKKDFIINDWREESET